MKLVYLFIHLYELFYVEKCINLSFWYYKKSKPSIMIMLWITYVCKFDMCEFLYQRLMDIFNLIVNIAFASYFFQRRYQTMKSIVKMVSSNCNVIFWMHKMFNKFIYCSIVSVTLERLIDVFIKACPFWFDLISPLWPEKYFLLRRYDTHYHVLHIPYFNRGLTINVEYNV